MRIINIFFVKSIRSGFTTIELVVAVAIFSLIGYGLLAMLSGVIRGSTQQSGLIAGADQARKVVFSLTNELRDAQRSSTGGYSLAQAGAQEIVFYANLDGDPVIERVRYYVSGMTLYRGVLKPSGNPLSYNPAQETSTAVQRDVGNGANPVFYYFDDTYNGAGTALAQPVNVTDVRLVEVRLLITNIGGISGMNTYPIIGRATIRNLKTNLGD